MDTVGYFTFLRTYARRLNDDDMNSFVESWPQCLDRVLKGAQEQLHVNFTEDEYWEVRQLMLDAKCFLAGRFLWQLGTSVVDRMGLLSLQNCAFIVMNEPVEPFRWIFNFLMLGAGVGFRILPEDVAHFPVIHAVTIQRHDSEDVDFTVPDSREGWVELLGMVMEAHFMTGRGFTYSCSLIRPRGAPIKGFGGRASGPDVLSKGMSKINKLLNRHAGNPPTTVDILDIVNNIGKIVVAGNVRRSAELALGDVHDLSFLRAKRWDLDRLPKSRSSSNNSVVCNRIEEILPLAEFWEGYQGNGEPYGFVNLELMRRCGRAGELKYPDPRVEGTNPCGEQSLENQETCCLAEIVLPKMQSREEMIRCVHYMYRICKHSLRLPCPISAETERVVHQNMRMGIGITGFCESTEEQKSWLSEVYEDLREFDRAYSNLHGFPPSIKLTTVKPSGTLSLLAGVSPGVHPAIFAYYIRRVRVNADSPLVEIMKKHGYEVEVARHLNGAMDPTTQVVSFPCKASPGALLARNTSAIAQLENVKFLQKVWSDNCVSVTIYYNKHELPAIKEWLRENYNDHIKSVSFLLHSDHGFLQAPYEEITEEQYEQMQARCSPIVYEKVVASMDEPEGDCKYCPVR